MMKEATGVDLTTVTAGEKNARAKANRQQAAARSTPAPQPSRNPAVIRPSESRAFIQKADVPPRIQRRRTTAAGEATSSSISTAI